MKNKVTHQKQSNYSFFNKILVFGLIIVGSNFMVLTCYGQNKSQDERINEMVSKINTDVDSTYIYEFEKTKFVPEGGKTLLIMGQTKERIDEYKEKFPNRKNPGGWSAYWAITEFVGVTESHTNITGTSQNHQMIIDNFPNSVLHSAMWMVGKWGVAKNVTDGIYDAVIKKYCDWAKTVNRPIYLRIGYEFDGPHNQLEPKEFKSAYKYIVDFMRSESVNNVAYVWHSYASVPYKNYDVSEWYPGDDYVDWVGVSIFGHAYANAGINTEGLVVLDFAKQHKKPVMAAETNPIFGIENNNTKVWDKWFANFFSLVYNKNIKAICFINEDWTTIKIDGLSDWKDARLYNNFEVSEAWFRETGNPKYLKESPNLFKELGFFPSK